MFLEAETSFGLNILQHIPANETFAFSPISIALALSLIHTGAGGETKSQITNAILYGANDEQLSQHYSFISDALRKGENGVTTKIANRVFVKDGTSIKPEFMTAASKKYNAGAEMVDFSNTAEAANIINKFAEEYTGGNVRELVEPRYLKDAVAILANAIHFNADWHDKFEAPSSTEQLFYPDARTTRHETFMSDDADMREYAAEGNFELILLPYADKSYKFAIFLPKLKFTLQSALYGFNGHKFQSLIKKAQKVVTTIKMPKMNIDKEISLYQVLTKIGVTKMFQPSAEFYGLAEGIRISSGVHKSVLRVDEDGTKPAAATGFKADLEKGFTQTPVNFIADHPFLFAVLKDNHPLFMGLYV